jgi:hypothetical protein
VRVIRINPPMFRQINQKFDVRGKPVLFCFGDTIYNPKGIKIPPQLMVHEGVHSGQQGNDPFEWWKRYIADATFRLDQELPAHRAEWQFLRDGWRSSIPVVEANDTLHLIAWRLSSPLYGSMIGYEEARRLIAA